MAEGGREILLELIGIGKSFPGVRALDGVSLRVFAGEVLALIGENGAGKSTLMNVLGGVHVPEQGEIRWRGEAVRFHSVLDSLRLGIAFVHQELSDLDNLDVAGNIWLGREPRTALGLMDRNRMLRESLPFLRRIGLDSAPDTPLAALSIGQRQLVEIARALSMNARLVIMDEPTSSLTLSETDRLMEVIASLKADGISVIYISHRLAEISRCADRVTALRDGKHSGNLTRTEITHDNMVRLMIGRDLVPSEARHVPECPPTRLHVERIITTAWPDAVASFALRGGEILGMAGLIGAGRSEMVRALCGIDPPLDYRATLDGIEFTPRHPWEAIQAGLYLVPEDRRHEGLVLDFSIAHNISLPVIPRFARAGLLDKPSEQAYAEKHSRALNIKAPHVFTAASSLSGGNQQKIVLARWLALSPNVLIFDEPTRGVDVGAKAEIYQLIIALARSGVAILVISSDMEELLIISDRIAVMRAGEISGILERDGVTEEAILRLAVPPLTRTTSVA